LKAELFAREEARITAQIESAKASRVTQQDADFERDELAQRFDQVVELLQELGIDQVWAVATFRARKVLVEELVEAVTNFPDHLEVTWPELRGSTSDWAKSASRSLRTVVSEGGLVP
jgi:hypothetical protein